MRRCWSVFAACVAGWGVLAFDSSAWLAERNDDADVHRLQIAYTNVVAHVAAPAENVAFPIEMYPNGLVKSRLKAEKAFLLIGTDFIWGRGVRAEQYASDGKTVDGWLTAEECVVDRKTSTGWVKGGATLNWNGTVITGEDVYFSFRRSFVKIFRNPMIETKQIGKGGLRGLALGNAGEGRAQKRAERGTTSVRQQEGRARIRSERLDYDREKGVAFFDRDVRLDDPEYEMRAQRLYAFMAGTNELRRIVALDNVSIRSGDRSALADRAVYMREAAKITLFGDNGHRAELRERAKTAPKKGKGKRAADSVVRGDRIVYWTDSDQVEVSNPEIEMPGHGMGTLKEMGAK